MVLSITTSMHLVVRDPKIHEERRYQMKEKLANDFLLRSPYFSKQKCHFIEPSDLESEKCIRMKMIDIGLVKTKNLIQG